MIRTLFIAAFALCASFCIVPEARAQSVEAAQQLQAEGNWAGAERAWRELVKSNPSDYRLWTSLGIALAHQERFDDAIADYRKALSIRPGDPQSELNLGIAYFKTGRLPEATSPLRRAVATMGNTPQTDILLGMSLFGTAHYREACPYLERAGSREPESAQLQDVLARAYLYGGEYDKANAAFEQMLLHDPESAEVHMLLGEAYDASGHVEKAIEEFRTAAQKNSLPSVHFGLGYLLWKDHRYEEAAAEFRDELASDPKQYQALAYLGDIEMKQGRSADGEKLLRESIALHDSMWLTHFHLGVLAADRKQYPTAISELKLAASLDPNRPEPHYRLAQIYRATGKEDRAKLELQQVRKLHQRSEEDLIHKISGDKVAPPAANH